MNRSTLLLFSILMVFTETAGADVVFSDGTFDDTAWSITLSPGSNNGTAAGNQVSSGGNPGEYRNVTHTVTSTSGLLQAFHLNSTFVYDPTVSGAIASIDWSVDFQNFQSGQAAALAFTQNGDLFLADVFVTTGFGTGTWNNHQLTGITTGDVSGVGGAIPDFSNSADPITFGFFTANSGEVGTFETGYDNLQITVRAVPEPGSLLLLVALGSFAFARTRSARTRCSRTSVAR